MPSHFHFNAKILGSILKADSPLEIRTLDLQNLNQANDFIKAYGYDLNLPEDEQKLWDYHKRACDFISSELLNSNEHIPEAISNRELLKDLKYLLIYASTQDSRPESLKAWSCALLRVMHVLAHIHNDLFTAYSSQISEQIVKPFQNCVFEEDETLFLGSKSETERIELKKFEIKSFKSSDSSILKLLAKREAIAFGILDKIGIRFITATKFDTFRVLRYLNDKSIISFPQGVVGQSNNTLYPFNLFLEVMESLSSGHNLTSEQVDELLDSKLKEESLRAEYIEKTNIFSGTDYKFIKFISRRLIRISLSGSQFSFFYPFEVQLIDAKTHAQNLFGASSHDEYKKRQRGAARRRILGEGA